jgi:predicted GTPase
MSIVKYHPPNAPYHIAILGRSGVGKSSLCNLILNLSSEHTNSAPVGVIETTLIPTCYKLFENVFIWDVPGVSTPSITKDDYCKLIDINRYDMFLILSRGRFTEIDLWLSDIVRDRFSKTLFFIRTGIDEELRNHRRDYPTNFNPINVLDLIRNNCIKNLETTLSKSNLSLYLINTKDKTIYDYPKLIDDIMIHINHERENRVLTLIKEDPQSPSSSSTLTLNTALQTAQTVAFKWATFGLVPYLYNRYYK